MIRDRDRDRDRARGRAVLVLVMAVLFAVSPLLVGGFDGFDPGKFPVPQVDPPVQPTGWTFSIWGLIYVWLIVHASYGVFRRDTDPGWDGTRLAMIAALGLGVAWIPVAEQNPLAATAIITLMLAAVVLALLRAPRTDRWLAAAPIGLFAGWLTAATGVSLGLQLAGWGLTGEIAAAIIALVWTIGLAAAVTGYRGEPAYAAGVIWALIGVVAANGLERPVISVLAIAGALVLIWLVLRGRARSGDARP